MTTGLNGILKNLGKEIDKIQGATLKGIRKSTLVVQEDSMDRTPVDFGVLRGSAFSQAEMQGTKAVGRIGYTAKYAAWVHEMPGTLKGKPRGHFGQTRTTSVFGAAVPGQKFGGGSGKGFYWDGGEPKFLQKALFENTGLILSIIQKEAKISGG